MAIELSNDEAREIAGLLAKAPMEPHPDSQPDPDAQQWAREIRSWVVES